VKEKEKNHEGLGEKSGTQQEREEGKLTLLAEAAAYSACELTAAARYVAVIRICALRGSCSCSGACGACGVTPRQRSTFAFRCRHHHPTFAKNPRAGEISGSCLTSTGDCTSSCGTGYCSDWTGCDCETCWSCETGFGSDWECGCEMGCDSDSGSDLGSYFCGGSAPASGRSSPCCSATKGVA